MRVLIPKVRHHYSQSTSEDSKTQKRKRPSQFLREVRPKCGSDENHHFIISLREIDPKSETSPLGTGLVIHRFDSTWP